MTYNGTVSIKRVKREKTIYGSLIEDTKVLGFQSVRKPPDLHIRLDRQTRLRGKYQDDDDYKHTQAKLLMKTN